MTDSEAPNNTPGAMSRGDAINLLEEAIAKLKHDHPNANGGSWQAGGAYWRVAKVLGQCLAPALDEVEGKHHADHLRASHGVIVRPEGRKATT